MKKILTLLLALLLALSLCACGAASGEPAEDQTDDAQVAQGADDQALPTEDGGEEAQSADDDAAAQPAEETKPAAQEAPAPTGTTQTKPAQQTTQQPTQQTAQQPVQQTAQQPASTAPTASDAAAYIGRSTSSLAAAIGQPSGKSYASSCLGEGEDGEWYYDGFTVYTYRDTSGAETVQDVL